MLSQDLEKPSRPTLEDLLKLKRFEKPDAPFWDTFDRQLEAKRLNILLKQEHWTWRAIKAFFRRRFRLCSGLAVAAFTLVIGIRQGAFIQRSALGLAEGSSSFARKDLALAWEKAAAFAFSQNIMLGSHKTLDVATVTLPCKTQVCYMNGGALPANQPTARRHASF